jgi:hypothetical protein
MVFSKSLIPLVALSITAAASMAHASPVNLIQNPGFETGTLSSWTHNVGDQSFVGVDNVDPNSGTYGAFLGSTSLGYLSQNVPTAIGATYYFSFFMASDGSTPNEFEATVGGSSGGVGGTQLLNLTDIPADQTGLGGSKSGTNPGYFQYSFTYIATASTTLVEFGSSNPNGFLELDDVSFALPEPASLSVLGLGALALLGRKGRKAANA